MSACTCRTPRVVVVTYADRNDFPLTVIYLWPPRRLVLGEPEAPA